MRLLIATRSEHKLAEIEAIFGPYPRIEVVGPGALGLDPEPGEEGLEPYDTFQANAASKARYFAERAGIPTVADDSGLVVDALGGEPGARSKRFAPIVSASESRDEANNRYLLERLAEVPPDRRGARYVCVVVLSGLGAELSFRGVCEGVILDRPAGSGGFGYDPLFHDPGLGRSFAELTPSEKNERSHRGKAFRALAAWLEGTAAESSAGREGRFR